jgi:hypothetical protein
MWMGVRGSDTSAPRPPGQHPAAPGSTQWQHTHLGGIAWWWSQRWTGADPAWMECGGSPAAAAAAGCGARCGAAAGLAPLAAWAGTLTRAAAAPPRGPPSARCPRCEARGVQGCVRHGAHQRATSGRCCPPAAQQQRRWLPPAQRHPRAATAAVPCPQPAGGPRPAAWRPACCRWGAHGCCCRPLHSQRCCSRCGRCC